MNNEIQFILYQLPDDEGKVQVVIKDETIWATQKAMAQLFDVGVPAISKHLKNIFEEGELPESSVVSKMEITASDGKDYLTSFYSLDAIIAVGYRVSSVRATRFRQWATKILNEYIRKGFVLDDDRLKQGTAVFGKDYFRELLEKVRSIRASERRIWQQISMRSVRSTTTAIRLPLASSTRWCRTVSITPLLVRLPLRLSTPVQTIQKITWVCRRGRMRLTVVCCSATQR